MCYEEDGVTDERDRSRGGEPVLVAPDSFKGTFDAATVAAALARGIERAGLPAERCPVADGGEGTLALLVEALGGAIATASAHGPLGEPLTARYGLLGDGRTAVIEVAQVAGLGLVDPAERDAEAASTRGVGELIVAAADAGVGTALVAAGGSATSDGGAGALGAIEAAGGIGEVELIVLCDVSTPFEDAARVFGPQKGADRAAVLRLTRRLHALADTLPRDPRGGPMSGAAGGLAGGLWAALGAKLVGGAAFVLGALAFDERVDRARAVVVGEGALDEQTLDGKVIGEIAARCRTAQVPLHAVVGRSQLRAEQARALGLASVRTARDEAEMAAAGEALAKEIAAGDRSAAEA